jgi:sugar phosphate permease
MSEKATPHSASGKDAFGQQVEVATPCNIGTTEAAYIACIEALSPEEQKRTIRRIDIRLVSTLGFLYSISLMDRNNTGIAMIAGMSTDLVMTGSRYSVVVLLFFIPYVLFQPPSTAILRKVEPRLFLSLTTLVWGLTTIASGFVKNWNELIPLRLILGACEAGFFPGESISIKKHVKLLETLNDARLCIHP